MEIRIFLPSDHLVQIARQTLVIVAYLAAITAVLAVGAGLLYALIWFCSVLTIFIHTFALLCQVAYIATGRSWVTEIAGFVLLLILNAKLVCVLFPSLPDFFMQRGARV